MACPDGSVTWFYEQAFAAGAPLDLATYPELEGSSNMTVSTAEGPSGENAATLSGVSYGYIGLNGDGVKDTPPASVRRNGMVQWDMDYRDYTSKSLSDANILDVRRADGSYTSLFWLYAISAEDYNDGWAPDPPATAGHMYFYITFDLSNYEFFDVGSFDANWHTVKVGWCSSTIDESYTVQSDGSLKVWVDDVEVYSTTAREIFGDTSQGTPEECGAWNMGEFQPVGAITNLKFGEFDADGTFYDCGAPDSTPDDLCNKANVVAWVEWDVTGSTTVRYGASMLDDPSTYYGGPKTPRVLKWGTVTRALSDFDGQWESARFSVELADTDRVIRGYVANNPVRGTALRAYLVSEEGRATAETPRVLFAGPLTKWTPTGDLRCELHGADRLANVLGGMLGRPERTVPSRLITGTDFPTAPATSVGKPVPIIYGAYGDFHADPADGAGICPVIYTGTRVLNDSQTWHEWVVAGHACSEVCAIYVNNVYQSSEIGTTWLIPGGTNWSTASATPYRDFNGRRYTVIYGRGAVPDDVAAGTKVVFCNIRGCEEIGDGTGTLMQDVFKQYVHWLINWGLQEY